MKKRIISISLSLCLVFLSIIPVHSAGEVIIPVYLDNVRVNFGITNGQQDNAIIIFDYAYVPIAKIIEILTGKPPSWNDATKTASFDFNGKKYDINTNQNGIYVDGRFVQSATGTPPVIVNDRTLIPLKMLSSVMGFSQNYNEATRSTYLTSPVATTGPPVTQPPVTQPPVVRPPVVAQAAIISVESDKTTINAGDSVNLTVRTNSVAYTVKVVDSANRTLKEVKSFRPVGDENIFYLDFKPDSSGTYTVYAAASANYSNAAQKSVSITVNTVVLPTIYSAQFASAEVTLNDSVSFTVVTSTDVTSVSYSILSGGGRVEVWNQTGGYSDSQDRRTWNNKYIAGQAEGDVRIQATVTTSAGASANTNLSIKAKIIDTKIYKKEFGNLTSQKFEPNATVTLYITTGLGTDSVQLTYNNSVIYATNWGNDVSYKYWIVTFFAGTTDNLTALITSSNSSGTAVTTDTIGVPVYQPVMTT